MFIKKREGFILPPNVLGSFQYLPQLGNLVTANEKGTFAQREMRDLSRNASRQVPFARSIEISLKSLRISEDVRFVI